MFVTVFTFSMRSPLRSWNPKSDMLVTWNPRVSVNEWLAKAPIERLLISRAVRAAGSS